MKYAMLIHYEPGYTDALSEDESKAMLGEYMALRDEPAARIPAARLGGAIEVRPLVER